MPPPQQLLDAMAEIAAMDPDDSDDLGRAILNTFGPCLCQQTQAIGGHMVFIEMCAGHRFLQEHDAHCTRIQRLRFARARREHWRRAEWLGLSGVLAHDLGLG
jgi:hypothetical protein